jgi:small subunit ribosomal protein S1
MGEPDLWSQEESLASLGMQLGDTYGYGAPVTGDLREGVIMRLSREEVLVDIGSKEEALLSAKELTMMPSEEFAALAVGQRIAVHIVRPGDQERPTIVSIERARAEQDWVRAQEHLESGETLRLKVTSCNRGGIVCQFGRLQGFVPASQIVLGRLRPPAPGTDRLEQLVGATLGLKIIEVDRRRRRFILSERQALRESRAQLREQLWAEIAEGQVRTGTVSNLADFGAFVDLGGMDGLVHISEISWQRLTHPRDLLSLGQQVEVLVLRADPRTQRIGLSLKRLQADPWDDVADRITECTTMAGTVTHLARFGVFVELLPGIEGLIHLSELSDREVTDPGAVVSAGDTVTVRVLSVEGERHQISLSLEGDLRRPPHEDHSTP